MNEPPSAAPGPLFHVGPDSAGSPAVRLGRADCFYKGCLTWPGAYFAAAWRNLLGAWYVPFSPDTALGISSSSEAEMRDAATVTLNGRFRRWLLSWLATFEVMLDKDLRADLRASREEFGDRPPANEGPHTGSTGEARGVGNGPLTEGRRQGGSVGL